LFQTYLMADTIIAGSANVASDNSTIETITMSLFFIVRQRCSAAGGYGSPNDQVAGMDEWEGLKELAGMRNFQIGFFGNESDRLTFASSFTGIWVKNADFRWWDVQRSPPTRLLKQIGSGGQRIP
jgi:hypothetical protein